MDITITITADDRALEFSRNLGGLLAGMPDLTKLVNAPKEKEEPKKTEPVEAPKTEAKTYTLEEVRKIASKALEDKPKRLALAIKNAGVSRVPDLKPEQYAEFVEFLNAE